MFNRFKKFTLFSLTVIGLLGLTFALTHANEKQLDPADTKTKGASVERSSYAIILYGTANDLWTRKQREYFDEKGIPYVFKDCSNVECRDGIISYPTMDNVVGYREFWRK